MKLKFGNKLNVFVTMCVLCLIIPALALAGSQTISSTAASAMVDRARRYLNDSTTYAGTQQSIWSDAEMLAWLNDGMVDIVTRTHCLEDVEAETLVNNQILYPLTDPFIVIKYVIYDDAKALQKGNLEDFGRIRGSPSTGIPNCWAQWENNVVVYPAPTTGNGAGNDIDVYVVDRPTAIVAATSVTTPAQYDKALVYYIVGQAWAKDNRLDQAKAFGKLYLDELDRFRQDLSDQPAEAGTGVAGGGR